MWLAGRRQARLQPGTLKGFNCLDFSHKMKNKRNLFYLKKQFPEQTESGANKHLIRGDRVEKEEEGETPLLLLSCPVVRWKLLQFSGCKSFTALRPSSHSISHI